jgi:hypothetical protein
MLSKQEASHKQLPYYLYNSWDVHVSDETGHAGNDMV